MTGSYDVADVATILDKQDPQDGTGARFAFLTDVLDCEEVRINSCSIPAGSEGPYHKHETQEEVYIALDGPGEMIVDGEPIEVPHNGVARVPAETPRKFDNRSATNQHWLVIGAPPVGSDDDMGEAVLVETE